MAEDGRRVLALALRRMPTTSEEDLTKQLRHDVESQLEFVGFIAFECQLRSDTKLVIGALQDSGHKVVMVTGDAPLTALHVAKACGIARTDSPTLLLKVAEEDTPSWAVAAGEDRGTPGPAEGIVELA